MEMVTVGVVRIWRVRLLCWLMCTVVVSRCVLALNEEGRVLLKWKQGLQDEDNLLSDWNPADATPCMWNGVRCIQGSISSINFANFSSLTGPVDSITFGKLANLTSFNVAYSNLSGVFPTDVVNCSKLVNLNISWTWIGGELPEEISRLTLLRHLDLSYANFNGTLTNSIGELQELKTLHLHGNYFYGSVPESISLLKKLQKLTLNFNQWTGSLPPGILTLQNLRVFWFGDDDMDMMPMLNLTWWVNMEELRLHNVRFEEGPFPAGVENMTKLEVLQLSWCNLTGTIPAFLQQMTHLKVINLDNNSISGNIPDIFGGMVNMTDFSVQVNKLTGVLPPTLWQCLNLEILFVYRNRLEGGIAEIGNLSDLTKVDISQNSFTGLIPTALSTLTRLTQLNLSFNNLSGKIPPAIADLEEVFDIRLNDNILTGEIPYSLGAKSILQVVDFSTNVLQGVIPPNLCRGNSLSYLNLMNNKLTGGIPDAYGECTDLDVVMLANNQLEGPVPDGLWSGAKMTKMKLNDNKLNGSIGGSIGRATTLSLLYLENNRFAGPIPAEIGQTILSKFRAYANNFSGALPEQLGSLSSVTELSLGENFLSGAIPPSISKCRQLVQLNLSMNNLQGSIPDALADLPNLANLDLSENRLSGAIPKRLFSLLQLQSLNVAFNNFSGVIPKQQNGQAYVYVNFTGNPYLCIEGSCPYTDANLLSSSNGSRIANLKEKVALLVCLPAVVLLLFLVLCLSVRSCKVRVPKDTEPSEYTDAEDSWILTSFQRTTYHDYEVTDLDEDNLIGSGGSGKVYRATLTNGESVAVKKLWGVKKDERSHDHGFKTEVKTLATIRHRHIVKLLCCCTKRDSNLLVYEYMPNGSLGDFLHSTKAAILSWEMRYKIAVGAAMGLQYLHHDCVPQILHRDIKSNNILLDMDYEAHLADFGIAKVVETAASQELSTIPGSLGYIAPEYAYSTRVDEKSDIYSFGVVLLELVTGKRAVDSSVLGEASDLVGWVNEKVQTADGVYSILDANCSRSAQRDMVAVLKVAMQCTSFLPVNRPSMRKVVLLLMKAAPTASTEKSLKASFREDADDESQFWSIFV